MHTLLHTLQNSMKFASDEIEQLYRAHFAISRFKFDLAASLLSTIASLSFYIKATFDTETQDSSITFLFLLLVVSKSIPLLAALHLGRHGYLQHRSAFMCAVSLLR